MIEGESLAAGRGGIIPVLQDHVRGMQVQRTSGCPRVVMRGGLGRSEVAEALVYLDGQRMSDTCILDALALESLQRIEAYPSGVTQRPGYVTNTGGLILIFSRNSPALR